MAIALALGKGDTLYAVNRGWEQVQNVSYNRTQLGTRIGKFTIGPMPGDEEFVADFSRPGDGPGQLIWPAGLALDRQDNVYVTDEWLNRISIFDQDGNFLREWGTAGSDDGEFNGPSGITSTHGMSCTSWTAATIGCRNSLRMASFCPRGAVLAAPRGNSTPPGALP